MKKIISIVIILSLFLIACEPAPTKITAPQEQPQIKEPEQIKPPEVVKEPEPVYEPLESSISVSKSSGELQLQTTASCEPVKGKSPYTIEWTLGINKTIDSCANKQDCEFSFDEIKQHTVSCKVNDQLNSEVISSTQVEVTKEFIQIDNILTFGDSLTYGHGLENPKTQSWPALFSKKYQKANLKNYAISGSTSWTVTEQHQDFELTIRNQTKDQHNLIFVWIGANDIHRFIPKEQYEVNVRKVIKDLNSFDNSKVFLVTIPDVSKLSIAEQVDQTANQILGQLGVQGEIKVSQIGKDIVTEYNNILVKIAKEENVPLLDMFSIMEDFDNSLISEDFFHPNAKGQQRIAKEMQLFVEQSYPKQEFN